MLTKRFGVIALVFFSGVAAVANLPVFWGRVPFAATVATNLPPFDAVRQSYEIAPFAEVGDSVTIFYPWRTFAAEVLRQGRLPLWNPHILSGTPFLANAQSGLFYPPNFILAFLPLHIAWTAKVILNLILAGVFTALFVRSIGGSKTGAIASGVIFALCGFVTAWQFFSSLADTVIWLPLTCLAVRRLCQGRSVPWLILGAVAFALPVLAGHPETAAHVVLVSALYAIWQSVSLGWHDRTVVRRLAWFAGAGLLAIGITAIQTLPTVEWLGQINHSVDILWGARPVRELLAFVSRDISSNPNSSNLPIPESASYAGALTLLLAPIAWMHRSRRESLFFMLLILVCIPIVVGWGPLNWMVEHTPLLRGVKNWRLLVAIDFSLAVLAGLGISHLSENLPSEPGRRRRLLLLATGALAVACVALALLHSATTARAEWMHEPKSFAFLLLVGYALIVLRVFGRIGPSRFAQMAVLLLCVDLLSFRYNSIPFVPPSAIFPDTKLFQFLRTANSGQFRVAALNDVYGSNFEMMYGLSAVGGYELSLRRINNVLFDFSLGELDGITLTADHVVKVNDRRLEMLNVRYFIATRDNFSYDVMSTRPDRFHPVFSDGSVTVFEDPSALPRALFVPAVRGAIEVLNDEPAQFARLKDPAFDPERSVVLPEMPATLMESGAIPANDSRHDVSWLGGNEDESTIQVASDQPGILVVSQSYYPGWVATVDGMPSPLLRADYALIGVALNGGTHRVVLAFRPRSFRLGSVVTLFTGLAMVGAMVFTVRKR